MRRSVLALLGLVGVVAAAACGGSSTGACVSSPVTYSYGQRVYCYSDWDKADCDANSSSNVNGASWTFHEGQSCSDRGLTDGSNRWP